MSQRSETTRPRTHGAFLSFRLPADLERQLRRFCDEQDQSISSLVRECVVEHLSSRTGRAGC